MMTLLRWVFSDWTLPWWVFLPMAAFVAFVPSAIAVLSWMYKAAGDDDGDKGDE